jgi:uncharacterized protein YhbP (UPF0306 family)
MNEEILNYIERHRISVLAIEMLDGSPHAATIHYAHTENPLTFLIETDRNYRKAEPLLARKTSRATMVIGFDEKEPITFQMDGEVRLIEESEKEQYQKVYLGKFPEKIKKIEDPNKILFVFNPTWWRYTDFTAPGGKLILTSTDNI